MRLLKGINKIDQLFDEVPEAESLCEKVLLVGQWMGLSLHWHFDYLAHLHRIKFVQFDDRTYERIFRTPGEMRTLFPQPSNLHDP